MVVNFKSTRGSLNPQGDKLKSTKEMFEKNSAILLIIIWFAFGGYKIYKYWESKTLGWLGNVWNPNSY